jgi:hypothetical protein
VDSFVVAGSVSSAGDSYSSLDVDSSVSETVDLFDRLFCCLLGSDDSDSGSDFTLTSHLFLFLRNCLLSLVPWIVGPTGAGSLGASIPWSSGSAGGGTLDEVLFSFLGGPFLFTVATIALRCFITASGGSGALPCLLSALEVRSICTLKAAESISLRLELLEAVLRHLCCFLDFSFSSSLFPDILMPERAARLRTSRYIFDFRSIVFVLCLTLLRFRSRLTLCRTWSRGNP